MDILGNQHLVIDGCKNILEYTTSTIQIVTPDFIVKITGENLTLKSLTVDSASIEGMIAAIEFVKS
ncbi:MAG: YabP/YqfC family sporulation protein [Oscillospiraceae bacterium]